MTILPKKRIILVFLSMITLVYFCHALETQSKKKSVRNLPEHHRSWFEEDVVYIITPKEKDVFLQLDNDRQRDLFIEAFWKHRDPNPNTRENEFKEEHFRRIKYANKHFGRESPGPGWRSAMGRIYIILGEPRTIERFESMAEVYPLIIWFYQGLTRFRLPDPFNIVFFKRDGIGEYRLYSPIRFGPQELLIHFKGAPDDYLLAFNELLQIEPSIAEVSLSLIPGEYIYGTPSLSIASEILISDRIPTAPKYNVEDAYAEKLLKYKDIVEVEYSANYIGNDSASSIFQDKSGIFFVHYLIEPHRISFEKYGGKFHTTLEVNINVSDLKGKTVLQYQRDIPIQFNKVRFEKIKDKMFSYQDLFPLIEGNYKMSILLKNHISKEFTSMEADIFIPDSLSLTMSNLILGNKIIRDSKYKGKNKPYLFKSMQLVPSPRNGFTQNDTIYVYFQIIGLDEELKNKAYISYSIFKNEEKIFSSEKAVIEYQDKPKFFKEFSLKSFPPANYKIKASLLDENKKEILSKHSFFYISHSPHIPRPWVLSIPMADSADPYYENILGNQYLNIGNIQKAKRLLEKAFRRKPNSVKFALDFCRALFHDKKYQQAKETATPFLESQHRERFLRIMGESCQALEEYKQAISFYKEYIIHFGTNLLVLNAIGECYFKLGNIAEALDTWKKSLELDPNQEELRKKINSIKEKKGGN